MAALAARLRELGYCERAIAGRLQVPEPLAIPLGSFPYYLTQRLGAATELDRAIALLLLQEPADLTDVERLLGAGSVTALADLQLVSIDRPRNRCCMVMSLYPIGEELSFADHRYRQLPGFVLPPAQPVMAPGLDTLLIARGLWPRPARRVLDLCSGSGALGLAAASRGAQVSCVDTNPRAVRTIRINAALRSLEVEALEGDLYAPVGAGQFDLILCNPPFVPAPRQSVLYRDGGRDGTAVLGRVLRDLPAHLSPGGVAQVVAQIGSRNGSDHLRTLRALLGDAPLDLHCLRVRSDSAEEVAVSNAAGNDYAEFSFSVKDWARNLAEQGFTVIHTVLLTLAFAASAPRDDEDVAPMPQARFAMQLADLIDGRRAARSPGGLQSRTRLVPGSVLIDQRELERGMLLTHLQTPPPLERRVPLTPEERAALLGTDQGESRSRALLEKGALQLTSS